MSGEYKWKWSNTLSLPNTFFILQLLYLEFSPLDVQTQEVNGSIPRRLYQGVQRETLSFDDSSIQAENDTRNLSTSDFFDQVSSSI